VSTRGLALINARLIDPASGHDGPGCVLVRDGRIEAVEYQPTFSSRPEDARVIDCEGAVLAPGLVDLRVKSGEPGSEARETLRSVVDAAAAGGVTTLVLQPDTHPAVDEPALVDFLMRRGRDLESINVLAAGALTRGLKGEGLAEIGLMAEAGAVYFTDADHVIADSRVLRRVMTYAGAFDALVAHRPADAFLTQGAAATSGELASRMGLPAAPAIAERMGLARDLALTESTGARLLVDQITTAGALEMLQQARSRGVEVAASVSINHLCFNEVDIGDYRTFMRLDPPLRSEADRQAMVEAVRDGEIDAIVSAHTPVPAEGKRLPFAEAEPGSVGLETLLAGALTLYHEAGVPLIDVLRPLTSGPADLIGLEAGRLAAGARADLVLFDPDAPVIVDADALMSRSKNSSFDGRRLQGRVLLTVAAGRIVWREAAGH
jgi:dihydroorotase